MKKIHLHGYLGRMFGKVWDLEVSSVREALEAINVNTKGKFRNYFLTKGREKQYIVKIGNYFVSDLKELEANVGEKTNEIHIIPLVRGKSGIAKIIIGVILIIIGVVFSFWGGEFLVKVGIGLVMSGIIQVLTPIPNWNYSAGALAESNIFPSAGPQSQGQAVPIAYGRISVPATPVSISITNQDNGWYALDPSNSGGEALPINWRNGQYIYGPKPADEIWDWIDNNNNHINNPNTWPIPNPEPINDYGMTVDGFKELDVLPI